MHPCLEEASWLGPAVRFPMISSILCMGREIQACIRISTESRNTESGWITVSTGLVGDLRDVLGNKGILHVKPVCLQDRLQCYFFKG